MNTVGVATLKDKLRYYPSLVEKGREIVVTSRGYPVARILPAAAPTTRIIEPTRPVKDLLKIKGVKRRGSVSALDALLSDRRRR